MSLVLQQQHLNGIWKRERKMKRKFDLDEIIKLAKVIIQKEKYHYKGYEAVGKLKDEKLKV